MIKSIIALFATSALALRLVQHLGRKQQLRGAGRDGRQHREEVSRWEEEGGNLPPAPAKAAKATPRRRARKA